MSVFREIQGTQAIYPIKKSHESIERKQDRQAQRRAERKQRDENNNDDDEDDHKVDEFI